MGLNYLSNQDIISVSTKAEIEGALTNKENFIVVGMQETGALSITTCILQEIKGRLAALESPVEVNLNRTEPCNITPQALTEKRVIVDGEMSYITSPSIELVKDINTNGVPLIITQKYDSLNSGIDKFLGKYKESIPKSNKPYNIIYICKFEDGKPRAILHKVEL